MDTTDTDTTAVPWRRLADAAVAEPVVRRVPYLELKLEHPGLEPTGHAEQFYPDAIPYERGGEDRVFYWQAALATDAPAPADWQLACATTHGLTGVATPPAPAPGLTTAGATGTIVVVEGTVAGDATLTTVGSYAVPDVRIERRAESEIDLSVDGTTHAVHSGERRRVELPQQRVEVLDGDESTETVTPVLAVRYPGQRVIHHPAPEATYRLFPSFGLDIDEVPNPLPVPTTAGELDDERLADRLGVDQAARPYAERVLWQAFAYTAFDPHGDATPALAQLPDGHIVLRTGGETVEEP